MADLSDVEISLTNLVSQIVYPNGIGQPSIAGVDIRVYPGWPIPENLDADLIANKVNISIAAIIGMERSTTRFDTAWQELSINPATLTLTVNNSSITIDGVVSTPQSCMVIVNRLSVAYAVQQNDTLATIAANLAALIPNAKVLGNIIIIPDAYHLVARVNTTGTSIRETKRQEIVFGIVTWAPSFTLRDQIVSNVDAELSAMTRIALPDGYYAHMSYKGNRKIDSLEKTRLYRRDLHYAVEFATTQTAVHHTIGDSITNISIESP